MNNLVRVPLPRALQLKSLKLYRDLLRQIPKTFENDEIMTKGGKQNTRDEWMKHTAHMQSITGLNEQRMEQEMTESFKIGEQALYALRYDVMQVSVTEVSEAGLPSSVVANVKPEHLSDASDLNAVKNPYKDITVQKCTLTGVPFTKSKKQKRRLESNESAQSVSETKDPFGAVVNVDFKKEEKFRFTAQPA